MKKLNAGKNAMLCLFVLFSSSLFAAPPGNDNCSSAVTLIPGNPSVLGTVYQATASGSPAVCSSSSADDDVWFKFTPKNSSTSILLSSVGSDLVTSGVTLQLISGTCGATLTSVSCSSNGVLRATGLSTTSTYFIRVYSTGTNQTGFTAANSTFEIEVPVTVTGSLMNEVYQQTLLTSGMSDPWEVTYGPDDYLWITEAKGYKVYRMDPKTGIKTTILDIAQGASGYLTTAEHTTYNRTFNIGSNNPQGGLAGLALHPDWPSKKFVYISYVQDYNSTALNSGGVFYTNSIVRFTYNPSTQKLESPITICDTLPGSGDHNSQRMIIAPVGGTKYLFYAAGDMGAGQFGNARRTNKAQITGAYEGKILRFNLDTLAEAGDATTSDKWIPNGNPYNTTSPAKQSAVWCIGIRNNQGFAYANGRLYGSSHGPMSDDEINIIDSNKNYGHPLVIGYSWDGNYNGSRAGYNNTTTCGSAQDVSLLPAITNEDSIAATITNYTNPIFSAYAASTANVLNIYTKANNTNCGDDVSNGIWKSEGWSGLDHYSNTVIPGWKNSLIACSLKWGRLVKIALNTAGTAIAKTNGVDTIPYFGSQNRFRDLAFNPNGKDIYVVMDNSTTSSGPSSAFPVVPSCTGCVQKYTFLGYKDVSGKSSIPDSIAVTTGTAGSCTTGTPVTIDNRNNDLWVPITGPDGNIMAEINANGQTLGLVQSSFYTATGVRTIGGKKFLARNIYIDPAISPASPVKIRLYFSQAQYNALVTAGGSSSVADLKVLQNNDVCGSAPLSAATMHTPGFLPELSGTRYMAQVNSVTLGTGSSFYFANSNYVLPMDLLTFNGSLIGNTTSLNWTTANENKSSHFIVERSTDGVNFSEIGTVKAQQNGSRGNYTFPDAQVLNLKSDLVYYRLKIVDVNNEFKYSNIITVTISDKNIFVKILPNPVKDKAQVHVNPKVDGSLQWTLIDNAGRVIQRNHVQVRKNSANIFSVNMEDLAQGTYYLKLAGAGLDKQVKLQKL